MTTKTFVIKILRLTERRSRRVLSVLYLLNIRDGCGYTSLQVVLSVLQHDSRSCRLSLCRSLP